jgi:hypothetical protein
MNSQLTFARSQSHQQELLRAAESSRLAAERPRHNPLARVSRAITERRSTRRRTSSTAPALERADA